MNFLHIYKQMNDEVIIACGKSMSQLLDNFLWDDDMNDYVRVLGQLLEAWIGLMQKVF